MHSKMNVNFWWNWPMAIFLLAWLSVKTCSLPLPLRKPWSLYLHVIEKSFSRNLMTEVLISYFSFIPFCFIIYLTIHRRLSTQNKITKQWQYPKIHRKEPIKVQNVLHNIKSQYPMFMSSFHGPVRVTNLKWKLCHTSAIPDDWQIRGPLLLIFMKLQSGRINA